MVKSTYHNGAYEEDKSRNGYGHLFLSRQKLPY
jgi:hypothetical protein